MSTQHISAGIDIRPFQTRDVFGDGRAYVVLSVRLENPDLLSTGRLRNSSLLDLHWQELSRELFRTTLWLRNGHSEIPVFTILVTEPFHRLYMENPVWALSVPRERLGRNIYYVLDSGQILDKKFSIT